MIPIRVVQMLGLNVYSYVEDTDLLFYKRQKSQAKKMDILDWIPGAYMEETVDGGENPIDRVRRVVAEEVSTRALVVAAEPLVQLHPGSSSRGPREEVEDEVVEEDVEEEEERVEGEMEEFATGFTQESEAPQRKKAMRIATPQSKMVPQLTVDDARDMYSRDATSAFRERRKMKGKKLYGDYGVEETIAISSEDEDDMEFAKRLRSDPPSPTAFAGSLRVKPEVLTVEEANAQRLREEEQRVRLARAAAEEPSMRNEVAELRALLLEQQRQRTMVQPPSSADLIAQVIAGMMAQGLVMAPPGAFPHLPPGFPPQSLAPPSGTQQSVPQQSFSFQHMLRPPPHAYAPVQQVDDPSIWRASGSSRPLTPPPLRPPLVLPPPHQRDDPHMFGSSDPNPPGVPAPPGVSPHTGGFGSNDPNPVAAPPAPDQPGVDTPMLDVEGHPGPGETPTPNPIDEHMHNAYVEVGLRQGPDPEPLQEIVAEAVGEGAGDRGGAAEASTASRHDQGEVIP